MGSKGPRVLGDFAKDYSAVEPQWVSSTLVTDEEVEEIIIQGKVNFSKKGFVKLKSEIESYIYLGNLEKIAPHKGGSGRTNDFFNQHILSLASIYKSEGGKITLGRVNPSRKHLYGYAKSDFLSFCEATNDVLPKHYKRFKSIETRPNQGLTRAIRRALSS